MKAFAVAAISAAPEVEVAGGRGAAGPLEHFAGTVVLGEGQTEHIAGTLVAGECRMEHFAGIVVMREGHVEHSAGTVLIEGVRSTARLDACRRDLRPSPARSVDAAR